VVPTALIILAYFIRDEEAPRRLVIRSESRSDAGCSTLPAWPGWTNTTRRNALALAGHGPPDERWQELRRLDPT
jgi:hypothetical protein